MYIIIEDIFMSIDIDKWYKAKCEGHLLKFIQTHYKDKFDFVPAIRSEEIDKKVNCWFYEKFKNVKRGIRFEYIGFVPRANSARLCVELVDSQNKNGSLYGESDYIWFCIKDAPYWYAIKRNKLAAFINTKVNNDVVYQNAMSVKNYIKVRGKKHSTVCYFSINDLDPTIYQKIPNLFALNNYNPVFENN